MDLHYLHLITNHIPVIGIPIALVLLVFGLSLRKQDIKKSAHVLLVIMGLMALPVYFTGEPSEEQVKDTPLVSDAVIEEHEAAAEYAIYFSVLAGLMGLIGLWVETKHPGGRLARAVSVIIVLVCLQTSAVLMRTAHLGGEIRRPELRGESTEPAGPEVDDFEDAEP